MPELQRLGSETSLPMWTLASSWLDRWQQTAGGQARLINLTENATHVVNGEASRVVLRLHRPGYQSRAGIESELAWLAALRRDTGLLLPEALPGRDGQVVQELETERFGVLFAHLPGREPLPGDEDLSDVFETLGRYAAIAHRHAAGYVPPQGFTRQAWTAASVLDPDGLWGDWRAAPGIGTVQPVLDRLDAALRRDLAAYGSGRDRYGLIHADMRLANVLVDGDRLALIDFDDCGYCWFMYDFAASISFHEDDPRVPEWRRRWLAGYGSVAALADADIAALDTMIMLRRMALLAWIGSHAETPLAQGHAPRFAAVTARLAEAYLAR